jgi:hypothetical protein
MIDAGDVRLVANVLFTSLQDQQSRRLHHPGHMWQP